ncbi:MAG: hypothetical protein ACK559_12985, partial [bacterium]
IIAGCKADEDDHQDDRRHGGKEHPVAHRPDSGCFWRCHLIWPPITRHSNQRPAKMSRPQAVRLAEQGRSEDRGHGDGTAGHGDDRAGDEGRPGSGGPLPPQA